MVASQPPQNEAFGPFDGLDDVQVLDRAKAALRRVSAAPMPSEARLAAWREYQHAKAELDMRLYHFTLTKIREGE